MQPEVIAIQHQVNSVDPLDFSRPGEVLRAVRRMVRQSRAHDPSLKPMDLYDVGFSRPHGKVQVTLYFRKG